MSAWAILWIPLWVALIGATIVTLFRSLREMR